MQISNVFMGAYHARQASKQSDIKTISPEKETAISSKAALAVQEIKKQRVGHDTVSLSEEAKSFLCSEEGYHKMKSDVLELYAKNVLQQKELMGDRTDDAFWESTGNQWMIFSENLCKNGFYDEMSDEEVKKTEDLLAKITAGMDHLSRTQYDTGIEFSDFYGHGANFFMDSSEGNLELTSATTALRAFSDKYVPDAQKEDFNSLIDTFYKHNTEIMKEYQSPMESLRSRNNTDVEGYLGGVIHTVSEKTDYQKKLTDLFKQMQNPESSASGIWDKIKDSYVDYVSKDSDDTKIRDYVFEQAKHTFSRIQGYWAGLV